VTGDAGRAPVNATVQVRIVVGKRDELVEGPDDADVVVTVARADCGLDAAEAYMQGRLKATGHTGLLFDALASGAIAEVLRRHAP
jgi:hypothetical protein